LDHARALSPARLTGILVFVGAESLRPIGTIAKADVILALAGSTTRSATVVISQAI
jgi:hypothetical protein